MKTKWKSIKHQQQCWNEWECLINEQKKKIQSTQIDPKQEKNRWRINTAMLNMKIQNFFFCFLADCFIKLKQSQIQHLISSKTKKWIGHIVRLFWWEREREKKIHRDIMNSRMKQFQTQCFHLWIFLEFFIFSLLLIYENFLHLWWINCMLICESIYNNPHTHTQISFLVSIIVS